MYYKPNTATHQPRKPDFEAKDVILKPKKACGLNFSQYFTATVFYVPPEENSQKVRDQLPEGREISVYTHMPLTDLQYAAELGNTITFNNVSLFYYDTGNKNGIVAFDTRNACKTPNSPEYNQIRNAAIGFKSTSGNNSPCDTCNCDRAMPKL